MGERAPRRRENTKNHRWRFFGFAAPWFSRSGLQVATKGRRALARAENRRQSRIARQLRAAIDGRDRQIELGSLGTAHEDHANRMKQSLSLLAGPRLHLIGDRTKSLAIQARRRRELFSERLHHGAGPFGFHLLTR